MGGSSGGGSSRGGGGFGTDSGSMGRTGGRSGSRGGWGGWGGGDPDAPGKRGGRIGRSQRGTMSRASRGGDGHMGRNPFTGKAKRTSALDAARRQAGDTRTGAQRAADRRAGIGVDEGAVGALQAKIARSTTMTASEKARRSAAAQMAGPEAAARSMALGEMDEDATAAMTHGFADIGALQSPTSIAARAAAKAKALGPGEYTDEETFAPERGLLGEAWDTIVGAQVDIKAEDVQEATTEATEALASEMRAGRVERTPAAKAPYGPRVGGVLGTLAGLSPVSKASIAGKVLGLAQTAAAPTGIGAALNIATGVPGVVEMGTHFATLSEAGLMPDTRRSARGPAAPAERGNGSAITDVLGEDDEETVSQPSQIASPTKTAKVVSQVKKQAASPRKREQRGARATFSGLYGGIDVSRLRTL